MPELWPRRAAGGVRPGQNAAPASSLFPPALYPSAQPVNLTGMSDLHTWPEGWGLIPRDASAGFVRQLRRELPRDHPLQRLDVICIGRHFGSDDIIFAAPGYQLPLFVAHLSWAQNERFAPALHPIETLSDLADYFG